MSLIFLFKPLKAFNLNLRACLPLFLGVNLMVFSSLSLALDELPSKTVQSHPMINKPLVTPVAPSIDAKAYILIDADSGKIIAEKNSEAKLPPASLTKMMTLYVISNALHHEQIHLEDKVRISHDAWKIGGSRMFVKEGDEVAVQDLLKGIIVDSGNDACVAMAEHLGGSELGFSALMNQQAQDLGMSGSHFTDSTGLPDENHYTTAKDLAILARSLVKDFPQYYPWYKDKWFTYNGIRQPNRNRLLWRNNQVDGIKTGHTQEAGFCLVSSAKRDNMRLISVVMGAPSDMQRADDSERLLNYGFRFFETHALYKARQQVVELDLYKGAKEKVSAGVLEDKFITIPAGQYQRLNIQVKTEAELLAPLKKDQKVGEVLISFEGKPVATYTLHALEVVESAGFYTSAKDSLRLMFKRWFG